MRYFLLSAVLIAALAVTACEQNSNVNDPMSSTDQSALLRAVNNLDLTNEQLAQLDEMYYLGEDLSNLLDPTQLSSFNTLIDGTGMSFNGPRDRGHMGFDIGAMMHLRLIIQANPDLDEQKREALLALIQESNARRLQLIIDYKDDPETLRAKLKEEHDALIAAMNALLTEEQLANVETLKEELKQLREERRALWNAQRIELLVQFYTQKLGLTEEQANQIREILENQYKQIAVIRAENEGDPEAMRAALEQLLKDTNDAIVLILTPEQLEIWENMRKLPMRWRPGHGGGRR
jgi:Spy/CpxP family protein refolding chaperone